MSNNLDVVEKLYAKKKSYKIPKELKEGIEQVTLEITPLSLEDMGLMNMKEDSSMAEISKNATIMFSKSLDVPEDKVSKISFQFMEDLLTAIMDANNFKDADIKKTGIKDFIEKKRKQEEVKKENAKSS